MSVCLCVSLCEILCARVCERECVHLCVCVCVCVCHGTYMNLLQELEYIVDQQALLCMLQCTL